MLIDTHCHLTDERLVGQIDEVLSRAKEAGVTKIIAPSTSLDDARKVVEITGKYDEIFGLVGVHPENILEGRFLDSRHGGQVARNDKGLVNELSRLVKSSRKIVGIGEIGLDNYSRTREVKNPRTQDLMKRQIEVFKVQLDLAVELGLPVAIHMREAENEMIEVLQNMKGLPAGQFHCWAGSESLLKMVLDKGFYVSFCGNITFKSAGNLRELVGLVPLNRLLLETDSPYLAPEPVRGSLNEPGNVTILAEYIANLLGLPTVTLINQTTANTRCLYFGG